MTIWIISFTLRGAHLAARLAGRLPEAKSLRYAEICRPGTGPSRVEELALWCRTAWEQAQGLIFVGAAGIAVRSVAPLLRKKTTDPAVVVIDEAAGSPFPWSRAMWAERMSWRVKWRSAWMPLRW